MHNEIERLRKIANISEKGDHSGAMQDCLRKLF